MALEIMSGMSMIKPGSMSRPPRWQAAEKGPSASLADLRQPSSRGQHAPLNSNCGPHAQRTESTPRVRPSGAASHLNLFERPAGSSAPPLAMAEARRPLLEEGLQALAHVAAHGAEDLVAVLERDGLVEAHVHVGAKSFFGEAKAEGARAQHIVHERLAGCLQAGVRHDVGDQADAKRSL